MLINSDKTFSALFLIRVCLFSEIIMHSNLYQQTRVQNTVWNKTGNNHWQLQKLLQVGSKHLCKETAKLWPCGGCEGSLTTPAVRSLKIKVNKVYIINFITI